MHQLQQHMACELPACHSLVQTHVESDDRFARLYREYLALGEELEMVESGVETIAADLVAEMREVRALLAGMLARQAQTRN